MMTPRLSLPERSALRVLDDGNSGWWKAAALACYLKTSSKAAQHIVSGLAIAVDRLVTDDYEPPASLSERTFGLGQGGVPDGPAARLQLAGSHRAPEGWPPTGPPAWERGAGDGAGGVGSPCWNDGTTERKVTVRTGCLVNVRP